MVFERPNRALFSCLLLVINCLLIAGNTGCGGGTAPNPNAGGFSQNPVAPPGAVSINPTAAVVAPGGTQLLTATVLNSTQGVNFTTTGGTLTTAPAGSPANSILFTAPATTGTFTITATSIQDPTKTATATIVAAAISISPTTATVLSGQQAMFTATISPAGTPLTPVFSATGGTITASGNSATFTAPATSGSFTVTASVSGNSAISASATVSVSSLALSPSSVSLVSTGTRMQVFTAMFSGTPFPVTFSASAGTITPTSATTATFTAPPGAGTYTVTVTSATNPAITGSATVNVILPVVTLFDVDGGGQTNRPVTMGRAFALGDIAQCPRPQVAGVSLSATDYQADVKNRWPDGSVKFAVLSFNMATVAANPGTQVTFVNDPSCNNGGALSQAQMANFNTGNWGAQMVVTGAGSTTVTTDAKTMLANGGNPATDTFGDCKNDYWLQGPVVTAVIVQDCTAASAFDFGWAWNGTTMGAPAASPNAATATFHPMFILYFYPKTNAVQVEYILETPWSGRVQDQLADITFRESPTVTKFSHVGARILNDVNATGFPIITSLSANFSASDVGLPIDIKAGGNDFFGVIGSVINSTTATVIDQDTPTGVGLTAVINLQIARTRHRKVFWTGTGAPGHIRIDHNFPYLKLTQAIPNYDPAVTTSPDSVQAITGCVSCTPYSAWAANDHGDIGGFGGITGITNDFSANSEGAPLQREDLLYLYNMASCGVANGACAKAYQMLTGERGTIDTGLIPEVPGGAGLWDLFGNVPTHMRESRTAGTGLQTGTNFFYCPLFDDKNAIGNTTNCGAGSGSATGKSMSRHAHSDAQNFNTTLPIASVGTFGLGGWTPGQCDHWLDFAYTPYLLTGSPYFLEEEQQGASYCLTSTNDGFAEFQSHAFFGYINTNVVLRNLAWTLQTTGRAAFISPDGTSEASYYTSMLNSNLEVTEGVMGIGLGTANNLATPLTPSSINPSCSGYNNVSANRWDFGRCSVVSRCTTGACTPIPTALHAVETGFCPVNTEAPPTILDPTVASSEEKGWQYHYFNVVLSELRELGFTSAAAVSSETHRRLEEMVGDSTYNPYLIQMYTVGVKDASGATACNGVNTDPFIATYARLKSAYQPNYQNITTFNFVSGNNTGNFACSDHGYSIVARAAGSFVQEFSTSSNDANCPGGSCTAAATWTWMNTHIPFFAMPVTNSNTCGVSDEQIKYALTPR